jgi:anti-sigma factor RsiW
MNQHLASATLNLMADGELTPEQMAEVNAHLAGCPACTADALAQMMLKSATARAGHRYAVPAGLRERVLAGVASAAPSHPSHPSARVEGSRRWPMGMVGWVAAAAVLLVSVSLVLVQRTATARVETAALAAEVFDQHVATLAANREPQVVSSDRHTVKPWFQGKIPFSFNLPEGLPADTALDGANLTYLDDRPVAQLLYHVGRHRVSVFLRAGPGRNYVTERAGFHVIGFSRGELEGVAVSDVDPARLAGLVKAIADAQGR